MQHALVRDLQQLLPRAWLRPARLKFAEQIEFRLRKSSRLFERLVAARTMWQVYLAAPGRSDRRAPRRFDRARGLPERPKLGSELSQPRQRAFLGCSISRSCNALRNPKTKVTSPID